MTLVQMLEAASEPVTRVRLDLTGAIQGVGFRPFVHRLANTERLGGFVRNTGDGVSIEVEGAAPALERFLSRLDNEMPPRAVIFKRCTAALSPCGDSRFVVAPSTHASAGAAVVMADFATCPDCLRDILDPADRRFGYAFTSCMHCGPRYSIIEALPYDRARTTMRHFPLCAACQAEYNDPYCRRFQAEPIACPDCGPHLALWNDAGTVTATAQAALLEAANAVRRGQIVALKGLGGFQLLVDAGNDAAVLRLRKRKQRPRKPFALMVPSLEAALGMAHVGEGERRLLVSPEAPIVLLRARSYIPGLAASVAPDNPRLGVMLPYTPLHHLLLREFNCPIVATSGNPGDESIVTDETEALERLAGIADCFLVHDRPIRRPVDDSVVRVMAGQPVILRRSRGYAPMPISYEPVANPVLALGGQQKNAVATGFAGHLFLSPHIGDLTAARTREVFARTAEEQPVLHGIAPDVVACDTHPDYHSTGVALASGLPVARVPHHLAHILACMVDNGLDGPVLGVAWDGTGDGGDGTIWGGEFLTVDAERFRRIAHLRPFRLPGGDAAVREPRRAALGLLHEIYGDDALANTELAPVAAFTTKERTVLATMLRRGINAPFTSSAGRLFDAIAAILGFCQRNSFEGEAAMALEFAASRARETVALPPFVIRENDGPLMIDWLPPVLESIQERKHGAPAEPLAAALHDGLSAAIVDVARRVGRRRVVLTGGCFQNARLTERTVDLLCAAGFAPYFHQRIPPNDGGLAVGQAVFAARPLLEEKT
ncbi:MAG TPA: carbamoyltransferase HypF [Acetobacteraceae bacterium]|nr:carbamoyltransferase HypF [Acetobacteraceae bacterium]